MNAVEHKPVLLEKALEVLNVQATGSYLDCTFGRGGHSRAILERLGPEGRLIALDRDPSAIAYGKQAFQDDRLQLFNEPFSALEQIVTKLSLNGQIDGILFDLGVSSPQLDAPERGFSFRHDGPLDMRMDPNSGQSAAEWLKIASEADITDCIRTYGEERHARRIARRIVETRQHKPIETTATLSELVARVVPRGKNHRINPATRTFQALRIFINDELGELRAALSQALRILAIGARVVVIAFHSLEDRIIKRFFRDQCRQDEYSAEPADARFALPFRRPLRPDEKEQENNPRARSAKLRALERVA